MATVVSVPTGASAVVGNVTATAPAGTGFFTLYAAGTARPTTSNLNYTVASAPICNSFVGALSPTGAFTVRCGTSAANCLIDITGFLF